MKKEQDILTLKNIFLSVVITIGILSYTSKIGLLEKVKFSNFKNLSLEKMKKEQSFSKKV